MQIRYYALLWSVVDGSDESNTMLQAVHQLKLANSVSGGSEHQQGESIQDAEASQNQTVMIQQDAWADVNQGCAAIRKASTAPDCGGALTGGLTSIVNLWAKNSAGISSSTIQSVYNVISIGKDVVALVFPLAALASGLMVGVFNSLLGIGSPESRAQFRKSIMSEVDSKIDLKLINNDVEALLVDVMWVTNELRRLPTEAHNVRAAMNRMSILSNTFRNKKVTAGSDREKAWAVVALKMAPYIAETELTTLMLLAAAEPTAEREMIGRWEQHFLGKSYTDLDWVQWADKYGKIHQDNVIAAFNSLGEDVDPWVGPRGAGCVERGMGSDTSMTGHRTCEWHSFKWLTDEDQRKASDPGHIVFGSISLQEELAGICEYSISNQLLVGKDFPPLNAGRIDYDLIFFDWRAVVHCRPRISAPPTDSKPGDTDPWDWCNWENILGWDGLGRDEYYNLCVKKHVDIAKSNVVARHQKSIQVLKNLARGVCDTGCTETQNRLAEQFLDFGMIKSNTHGCCQGTALTGGRVGYASASECVTECVSEEQCMAISYDNGWCTRYTDCVSIGSACGASSSTWETWLNKNAYTFKHDGHCATATATGWMRDNTQQNTISDCASHCSDRVGCEYFAYAVGSRECAEYTLAGGCTDDGQWLGYKSYQMLS